MSNWQRSEKIALCAIAVTLSGIILAFFRPEFRQQLGLKPENLSPAPTGVETSEKNLAGDSAHISTVENEQYKVLPASLIRTAPYLEYTITIPQSSGWIDTRILVKRNQEVWIRGAEDSPSLSWIVRTDTDSCSEYKGCEAREDEHGEPVSSNFILGDEMNRDTLKIANESDRNPLTVNIGIVNKGEDANFSFLEH